MPVKYGPCLLLAIGLIYVSAPGTHPVAQPRALPGTGHEHPALQSFWLDRPGEYVFHFREFQGGRQRCCLR